MRIVVAQRRGKRGEGLGNECFAWAKGWIAAQVLDAHLVGPAWGINARRYYRNFGTSRLDVVAEEILLRLPHHTFTEADYRATGQIDYRDAIKHWADIKGIGRSGSFIVSVAGMFGGYPAIYSAKTFLLSKLLSSRDALANIFEVQSQQQRGRLTVAVHMRFGGDFTEPAPGEDVRGKFNIRVPDEWYLWVCSQLQNVFGDKIQFYFFTDRGGPGYDAAVQRFNPGQVRQRGLTECSDLILMSQADLRVCSISSYSLIASFLSGGPYLWYEPQLNLNKGIYSIWSHEPAQLLEGSLSRKAHQFAAPHAAATDSTPVGPGATMALGEPLPAHLITQLQQKLSASDPRANLLEYGAVARKGGQTPIRTAVHAHDSVPLVEQTGASTE